jgi:uncharacterized membrane protein
VWPLAAFALLQEGGEGTAWARVHARQALVFGVAASLAYLVVLALPLLIVIAVPRISTSAVVWLYVAGLVADIAAALLWLALSLRYRDRTLRGELFAIPLVTPIADRLFRHDRNA